MLQAEPQIEKARRVTTRLMGRPKPKHRTNDQVSRSHVVMATNKTIILSNIFTAQQKDNIVHILLVI